MSKVRTRRKSQRARKGRRRSRRVWRHRLRRRTTKKYRRGRGSRRKRRKTRRLRARYRRHRTVCRVGGMKGRHKRSLDAMRQRAAATFGPPPGAARRTLARSSAARRAAAAASARAHAERRSELQEQRYAFAEEMEKAQRIAINEQSAAAGSISTPVIALLELFQGGAAKEQLALLRSEKGREAVQAYLVFHTGLIGPGQRGNAAPAITEALKRGALLVRRGDMDEAAVAFLKARHAFIAAKNRVAYHRQLDRLITPDAELGARGQSVGEGGGWPAIEAQVTNVLKGDASADATIRGLQRDDARRRAAAGRRAAAITEFIDQFHLAAGAHERAIDRAEIDGNAAAYAPGGAVAEARTHFEQFLNERQAAFQHLRETLALEGLEI